MRKIVAYSIWRYSKSYDYEYRFDSFMYFLYPLYPLLITILVLTNHIQGFKFFKIKGEVDLFVYLIISIIPSIVMYFFYKKQILKLKKEKYIPKIKFEDYSLFRKIIELEFYLIFSIMILLISLGAIHIDW